MEKYVKFLQKIPKQLRNRIILVLEKIALNELKNLDIKRLSGAENYYRCRVGKVRIIFEKRGDLNMVVNIGFRGDVY